MRRDDNDTPNEGALFPVIRRRPEARRFSESGMNSVPRIVLINPRNIHSAAGAEIKNAGEVRTIAALDLGTGAEISVVVNALKGVDLGPDPGKGADLGQDPGKGADLGEDPGKGADLGEDPGKGADLVAAAKAADVSLLRLERLLAKVVVASMEEAAKQTPAPGKSGVRLSATERAIRGFESDNGGFGVDDVLADIIGYVDDVRSSLARVSARSAAARKGAVYSDAGIATVEPVEYVYR